VHWHAKLRCVCCTFESLAYVLKVTVITNRKSYLAYYRRAALMPGRAQNLLWHLLASALDMVVWLFLAFGSC